MYKVLKRFADLEDNKYLYEVGDEFPHRGVKVSAERLKTLMGSDNLMHEPLIEEIKTKKRTKKNADRDLPRDKELV